MESVKMTSHIGCMISRWSAQENILKNMATVAPAKLLKTYNKDSKVLFARHLQGVVNSIEKDKGCILDLFHMDNSYTTLCLRFQYLITHTCATRLLEAWNKIPLRYTDIHLKRYFASLLLPPTAFYHPSDSVSCVVADLLPLLYRTYFIRHINDLRPPNKQLLAEKWETFLTNTDSKYIDLYKDEFINRFLKMCAVLCSYPILPENIRGFQRSTNINANNRASL